MRIHNFILLFVCISFCLGCSSKSAAEKKSIQVGAEQFEDYLPQIQNKKVGLVANHTSIVHDVHLLDTLLSLEVDVAKIFSPEHGFRGRGEAGEKIHNETDAKTGIPIVSLYGKNYKPKAKDLQNIEVLLFDIQDVGVRFYTYISTMHYIMEACAENNIPLIVLDRPNPNGYYLAGPVLDTAFASFVGLHPIPLVHGLTIGELAFMINGEKWIQSPCELSVIACKNYTHKDKYTLPVQPSPNLPNMQAVYLYPSLGLFEGTTISIGRGTAFPFQVYGHPVFDSTLFQFTPQPIKYVSSNPKHKNKTCYGYDLREIDAKEGFTLEFLINAYHNGPEDQNFFNNFFPKLAGNKSLQAQIEAGLSAEEIAATWKDKIALYKKQRKKYLLYKDF